MELIFKRLASGALLLATMSGCDLEHWCIDAFGPCGGGGEGGSGSGSGSETGKKASGVNVQNCTIQDLDPYSNKLTARSFAVWATTDNVQGNPNPSWIPVGDINAMVTGQTCPADGPMVSLQFPADSVNWTVRVIKSGLFGNESDPVNIANCGSGDPNDSNCAGFREDRHYTTDPSAPMDMIIEFNP